MTTSLDNPAIMLSHALRSTAAEEAGAEVGLYTLEEKLGDGGFGSVWRASQTEPVQREVALKIIKLGMDTLEVMSRFEQERVALSMMDHPNIAKVLDAGATPEGRPFFAMELVRGVPITAYCLEKQLPLEQRLHLFKEVCAGVQHAHQKGIIHRDLKPSNILVTEVDGEPVPTIIDFGIAKAVSGESLIDHTLRTRAEQLIGTPLYMSPEQAEGSADIDTRSDVYALGVLLYELLAGRPPFDAETLTSAGREEMRRIIREVEPRPPSSAESSHRPFGRQAGESESSHRPLGRSGDCRSDAASMTFGRAKAREILSRDLDLITLRALAKDRTRRYESATAFAEDVQRFLNHQPVTARAPSVLYLMQRWMTRHRAAAAALVVSLVAIMAGTSVAVWQAVRATKAQHAAETQLADAEAATKLITDTLASMPGSGPESLIRRSELMQQLWERVRDFQGDPLRKMTLLTQLGDATASVNSIPVLEEALAIARKHLGPDDERLWSIRYRLANHKVIFADRRKEGVEELRGIVAWYRAHVGPDDHSTVHMTFALARNLNMIGSHEEALKMLAEVVRQGDEGKFSASDRTFYHLDYARALFDVGRKEEARAESLRSRQIALQELSPESYDTGRALLAHAEMCQRLGLLDEAAPDAQKALAIFIRAQGAYGRYSQKSFERLVDIQKARGDTDALLATHREYLREIDTAYGPAHEATALQIRAYVHALDAAGRKEETDQLCQEWIARIRRPDNSLPDASEEILRAHIAVLRSLQRWPAAESGLRDLLRLMARVRPTDIQCWSDQSNLGDALIQQGRFADAVPLLEASLAALEKAKDRRANLAKDRLERARAGK